MYQITLSVSSIDWAQVATVVVAGVGIVLGVLIVLIGVFSGFGALISKLEGTAKKRAARKAAKKADKQAEKNGAKEEPVIGESPTAAEAKAAPAPVAEQGISGEVVAAITAAITASEGTNQFVIRSVKKKNVGSRNPWARAAVTDNTRAF
ncbi:MAG: hypothetical protein HFJ99_03755 [Eubacterium sp.]|nr:hypothetical protein [Eubacterium sp.]